MRRCHRVVLLTLAKPVKRPSRLFQRSFRDWRKERYTKTGSGEALTVFKRQHGTTERRIAKSPCRIKDSIQLKNQVEMTITPEGLRIEMLETSQVPFFNLGSHIPK